MKLEWEKITRGKSQDNGYLVAGVGLVFVSEREHKTAEGMGGNPIVELSDRTAGSSTIRQYVISSWIPNTITTAERNKRTQLEVLQAVYELADGGTTNEILRSQVVEFLQMEQERVQSALDRLNEKYLIDYHGDVDTPEEDQCIYITRAGVHVVESPGTSPIQVNNQYNTNNIKDSHIGAVQAGSNNRVSVQQYEEQIRQMQAAIDELRDKVNNLQSPEKERASELVAVMETEVEKQKPSNTVLQVLSDGLKQSLTEPTVINAVLRLMQLLH